MALFITPTSGGYCVWLRMEYPESESLKNFNNVLDELINEGLIEEVRRDVQPEYCFGKEGLVHVFRRLK